MSRTLANASAKDRPATDFYPTPPPVTKAFALRFLNPNWDTVLEPACGDGRMVDQLRAMSIDTVGRDIATGNDFLTDAPEVGTYNWIVTNPPFNLSVDFIMQAHRYKPLVGIAMLLKSQYWHSAKRIKLFELHRPAYVCPLTWRPDFLFGTKAGAPTMDVIWTVWLPPLKPSETRYELLKKPLD